MNQVVVEISKFLMSDSFVALIGLIFGAIISLCGVWLTNCANLKQLKLRLNHDKNEKLKEIEIARLEELFVLVSNWLNLFEIKFLTLSMVMSGELTYNQYLDQMIENGKNEQDFQRIKMIVGIYGTSFQSKYDDIIDARTKLNTIETEYKHEYEVGNIDGAIYMKPYIRAQEHLEITGNILLDSIAKKAKNLK